jgi:hypothetical protein
VFLLLKIYWNISRLVVIIKISTFSL